VVSYINCSAAVKAQSDLICPASNAVRLVQQLQPSVDPVFPRPETWVAGWPNRVGVNSRSGPELQSCRTFSEEGRDAAEAGATTGRSGIAHTGMQPNLLDLADFIGSHPASCWPARPPARPPVSIVLTEPGILHQMRARCGQEFFMRCRVLDGCSFCKRLPLHAAEHAGEALALPRDDGPAIAARRSHGGLRGPGRRIPAMRKLQRLSLDRFQRRSSAQVPPHVAVVRHKSASLHHLWGSSRHINARQTGAVGPGAGPAVAAS